MATTEVEPPDNQSEHGRCSGSLISLEVIKSMVRQGEAKYNMIVNITGKTEESPDAVMDWYCTADSSLAEQPDKKSKFPSWCPYCKRDFSSFKAFFTHYAGTTFYKNPTKATRVKEVHIRNNISFISKPNPWGNSSGKRKVSGMQPTPSSTTSKSAENQKQNVIPTVFPSTSVKPAMELGTEQHPERPAHGIDVEVVFSSRSSDKSETTEKQKKDTIKSPVKTKFGKTTEGQKQTKIWGFLEKTATSSVTSYKEWQLEPETEFGGEISRAEISILKEWIILTKVHLI